VVPDRWIEPVARLRRQTERHPPLLSQAVLEAFMAEGHFGKHLRRMRELYGARLEALQLYVKRYLEGAIRLPEIQAGLNIPAFLTNGMSSKRAGELAEAEGLDVWPLDEFSLTRRDPRGLLIGFAAFNDTELKSGAMTLAKALEK